MKNAGEVPSFDPQKWIDVAQVLIDADEPERALEVLTDKLPAYYRDHTPQIIIQTRNKIISALMTGNSYADCADDSKFCEDQVRAVTILKNTLRGQLILKSITELNEKQIIPHVLEIGPGEYWLPIGLRALGLEFTYDDIGVNEYTKKRSESIRRSSLNPGAYLIYVACEIIEHIADPKELAVELMRKTQGAQANEIHLSTPLYTYDASPKPIKTLGRNSLPHLRAYTPSEFMVKAVNIFGAGYNWEFNVSPVMSLVGRLK